MFLWWTFYYVQKYITFVLLYASLSLKQNISIDLLKCVYYFVATFCAARGHVHDLGTACTTEDFFFFYQLAWNRFHIEYSDSLVQFVY